MSTILLNRDYIRQSKSIAVVVCLCALISIYNCIQYEGALRSAVLLPSVYILFFCFFRTYLLRFRPGLVTLNIVLFLRYVIMPATLSDEVAASFISQIIYLPEAIYLMLYEEICVFLTIVFVTRKFDRKVSVPTRTTHICSNLFLFYSCVAVFIVLCLLYPALLGSWGAFTGEYEIEELEAVTSTNGVVRVVFGLLEAVIVLWIIDWCRYKYGRRASNVYPIIATLAGISYLLLIQMGSVRISRWQLLVCGAAMFTLLVSFFPRSKKLFVFALLLPACFVILLLTGIKNFSYDLKGKQEIAVNGDLSNAYFAGPYNVSAAISLAEQEQSNRIPLLNDVMYGIPGISRTIRSQGTSSYLFNRAYHGYNWRNDAIIPLIGQSYYFFGPILSPIFSVLIVFFLFVFDRKYLLCANDNIYKYIYAYIAIWLGIQSILNVTICLSWFYQRVIPLIVILWLFAPKIKTNFYR